MKMLIAIVGLPGEGKTEAAGYLREKRGFAYLRFGDVVEFGLKEEGKELNEKNEREYRERVRKELGMKAMAVKLDPHIEKLEKIEERIVLDGLYSWEEYVYLKKKYQDLAMVCIFAPPLVRYKRLMKRKHRALVMREARSRDVAELENLNKGGPIALADFWAGNEGSVAKLYSKMDKIIGRVERGEFWKS